MSIERVAPRHGVIDVLDRVLDKGLVIDASLRVSVAGIEIVGVGARVVVASIETCATLSWNVAKAETVPKRRRRGRTVNARCEHGCTFVTSRAALPSTVSCPFDGGRVCSVAAPAS